MFDPATWGDLPEYVVLALPLAAAATLFALLVVVIGRRRKRSGEGNETPMTVVSALAPEKAAPAANRGRAEIEKRITAAIAAGDDSILAPLYLELSRRHAEHGDEAARMVALRSAAGCGARHGPPGVHAAARLELAEAAYVAGDLTDACEQWQLARSAFLDDGQKDQHERVEKRMRDNGCPTDWVLNDF